MSSLQAFESFEKSCCFVDTVTGKDERQFERDPIAEELCAKLAPFAFQSFALHEDVLSVLD